MIMKPSMIGQDIEDEPCAKYQALFTPAIPEAFLEGTRSCVLILTTQL
jgi:hypothetical protein